MIHHHPSCVLAADLLQTLVNNMLRNGQISLPIETHDYDFPIVQYADDTLVIMNGSSGRMHILMNTLDYFAKATGLRVSFAKSCS